MFEQFLPELKQWSQLKLQNLKGSCIPNKLKEREIITTDSEILQTVKGLTLEFLQESSINNVAKSFTNRSKQTYKKGIVINTAQKEGEFISPIFLRSTPDGANRVILNLKNLNQTLEINRVKMETTHLVAHLIQRNYYMLKITLKYSYYCVKILEEHTEYLEFFAGSKLFKFSVLPNGLSSGPRKFTKLTRLPIAVLRLEGIRIVIYIDE